MALLLAPSPYRYCRAPHHRLPRFAAAHSARIRKGTGSLDPSFRRGRARRRAGRGRGSAAPPRIIHGRQEEVRARELLDSLRSEFCVILAASMNRCDRFDLHRQIVPYAGSLAWQESVFARKKRLVDTGEEDPSDTLIALQHAPVYTLGRTTNKKTDVLFKLEDPPCEVHPVKRGGKATYHGPGQLVMYPILNLRYLNMDLDLYLRALEEVIIRALRSAFSIEASRVPKLTGVWVGDQKVAAIGIQFCFHRSLVCHGLALNVTTDLTPFKMIVPCGIKDRGVGSIKEILLRRASDQSEVDDALLMDVAYNSLIKEFVEVFNLSLEVQALSEFSGKQELN